MKKPIGRYKRARHLKKATSRAKLDSWYTDAIQHDEQLHYVVTSAQSVKLYHFDKLAKEWTYLSEFSKTQLLNLEYFDQHKEIVLSMIAIDPSKGLGVVIHESQDIIFREGRRVYDSNTFEEINVLLKTVADDILDDPTATESTQIRRAIPLEGHAKDQDAYLIANIKDAFHLFLKEWRYYANKENLPIVTDLLASLPIASSFLSHKVKEENLAAKASIILTVDTHNSFIAFYDVEGRPAFYRVIQHFGGSLPQQLVQTVLNTADLLQFEDYNFFYTYASEDKGTHDRLKLQFDRADINHEQSEIEWDDSTFERLELAATTHFLDSQSDPSLFQTYIDYEEDELEVYPEHKEMKFLNLTDLIKKIAAVLIVLAVAFQVFNMFRMMTKEQWKFDASALSLANGKFQKTAKDKSQMLRDHSQLTDRSKSWEVLEFLSRSFPYSEGYLIKDYRYQMVPIREGKGNQVGLLRKWIITGSVKDDVKDELDKLRSNEQVEKLFTSMDSDSYSLDGEHRTVFIDIETSRGRSTTNTHPLDFTATITQRIESKDPLAITVK